MKAKQSQAQQPILHPTAAYSTEQLRQLLGLAESTLRAEKRAGRIKWARRAGRDFYLGQWVLDWIEGGVAPSAAAGVDSAAAREG